MLVFICLFIPALISLGLYEVKFGNKMDNVKRVYLYGIFNLLINLSALFIALCLLGNGDAIFTGIFSMKYMFIGIVLAVFYAIVIATINKNVQTRIEVTKNEEKKPKTKKK